MPDKGHYRVVARELKAAVRAKGSFETVRRIDITSALRRVSGEHGTRIKCRVAADLEQALANEGLRCFPSLDGTEGQDYILVFNAGGVLGYVVDLVAYPTPASARELGIVLRKIKGMAAPDSDQRAEGENRAA